MLVAFKMAECKALQQELRLENLGFHFNEPSYFVGSQWSWCGCHVFVLYRLLVATYFCVWLVWTFVKEAFIYEQHVVLYFTTWVATITAVHAVSAGGATFYHHVVRTRPGHRGCSIGRDVDFPMSVSTEPIALNPDANGDVTHVNVITGVTVITPWHIRVTWLLYDVTLASCGLLTLLYWPLVYDGRITDTKLCNNALNTLLLVVDLFVARTPVRLLHVVYGVSFFVAYVIFNAIYSLYGTRFDQSDGRIYSAVDWRRSAWPVVGACAVVVVVLPAVQLAWYCLYRLRLYLWRRYGQG